MLVTCYMQVIEHDSRMAAAVTNEVQLMLSCNHPNVVRAYHYITHAQSRSPAANTTPAGSTPGQLVDSADGGAAAAGSSCIGKAAQQQQQQQRGDRRTAAGAGDALQQQQQQSVMQAGSSLRTSSLGVMQQLLAQEGQQQGSGSAAAAAATQHAQDQQQQRAELQQLQQDRQQQDQLPVQQQQGELQVRSGLLAHDLPPALPATSSSSSTGGGRQAGVSYGTCDVAEDDQWENVRTWLIQVSDQIGVLCSLNALGS
jgi:hypothetical protein